MTRAWEFWIDRGGTFTDVVARTPSGELTTLKLLSADPARYEDAAVAGIERLLAGAPEGDRRIAAVKMGTTVATNALLERRGEPTVLVITAGFEDAIRIGGQQRPEIFALDIHLPEMLYARVVGAAERLDASGRVLAPLDAAKLERDLLAARAAGFDSVAIVLLHGYRFPQHEIAAAEIARALSFKQVSVSHRVLPLPKLVVRGDTTLADAYLSPVLDRYVASVRRGLDALGGPRLYFMQSHGGLAAAEQFRGKDSLLSGPAGGVAGMVRAARAVDCTEVIGFDMGGTSTDVALFAGELERTTDTVIAQVRVSAPMLRIETVAAGGGSILSFGFGRLKVGPESAGAFPGPACYRHGGPLTVTDANLLLGRIQPEFFPRVFGRDANEPLDAAATTAAFAALARDIAAATGDEPRPEQIAAGFLKIAVERMANAIKHISVQRGHDITRFALCCFGGAGGQHAAQVAETLGIRRVIIHPLAGVLSAYGLGLADVRVLRQASVEEELDGPLAATLAARFEPLAAAALSALREQGADASDVAAMDARVPEWQERTSARLERRVLVKVAGADTALPVTWQPAADETALASAFRAAHERHFGYRVSAAAALIVESLELEAVVPGPDNVMGAAPPLAAGERVKPITRRDVWCADAWRDVPVYDRARLPAGARFTGPALIVEANATTIVEPGWRAEVHATGTLVLTRIGRRTRREQLRRDADPIMLEVFNNLFMHVAEEMGIVLEHTAHSVNI
ncbi:MAG TPA: hydantoinase/oxoprolinase family protein, partial [Gammaproteobacteria bacterium]|nr:hydantoinase/oxoprolinase family protein [Gammaproteobacteria bacterium]